MAPLKKLACTAVLLFDLAASAEAQCAMCRANAESNLKSGKSTVGRGLNTGILYLMSVPYLLAGVGAVLVIRHRRRQA
jgi:hypothetical protein